MIGNNAFWTLTGSYFGDPYWANTVLLLHGDGTNTTQNNTFLDSSPNNLTITRNGNPTQGTFSPFTGQGGSMYFDGSGDYLSVPASSNFDFGSGDFSIEGWIKSTNPTSTTEQRIVNFDKGIGGTGDFGWNFKILNSAIYFVVDKQAPGVTAIFSLSAPYTSTDWNHIAVTKNGGTTRIFINGAQVAISNTGYTIPTQPSPANPLTVGIYYNYVSQYVFPFNGYLSNLRISKGIARYTTNFTPPTAPLTSDANTSLLLKGENGAIIDSTRKNDLETVGNAQISTAQSKFGGSSMYFSNSVSSLRVPSSDAINFGSGDFTVEMWINPTVLNTYNGLFDMRHTSATPAPLLFDIRTGSKPYIYINDGVVNSTGTSVIPTNQWTHLALVRKSNNIRVYVNGIKDNDVTFSGTINSNLGLKIGAYYVDTTYDKFNGYIDDLRITKGVARYNANFTVPTQPFPNW